MNEIIVDEQTIDNMLKEVGARWIYDVEYVFKRAFISELIRCKDCKYYRIRGTLNTCDLDKEPLTHFNEFDYCSRAKRMRKRK